MSKRVDRPHRRDSNLSKPHESVNERIARVLDSPGLVHVVPRLAPEVLHQLIQQRGLESSGALVAAATPQQLASVLDLDLWKPDDRFDDRRFGSWLEMLMDEGEAVAARAIAAMDRDLAIAGLSRYVRVFDAAVFTPVIPSDERFEQFDSTPSAALEQEVGGYVVRGHTATAWDAIVSLLVTLDAEEPDCFQALMRGCRRLSSSAPEANGFHDLMREPDQWLYDVSRSREHRQSQRGYLAAADARAFLQMARLPPAATSGGSKSVNAIAAAYFRTLDELEQSTESVQTIDRSASAADQTVANSIETIVELFAEAVGTTPGPKRLTGEVSVPLPRTEPLQTLMEQIHDADPAAAGARDRELAFLANVLLAGCSVYSRAFTQQEAWNAAAGTCNLGLEINSTDTALPASYLGDHDLLAAFEAGWRLLHSVRRHLTERLLETLGDVRFSDPEVQRDVDALLRRIERSRDTDGPLNAGDALDVLTTFDMLTWTSLCGLLNECPVVPAAMTALLERHKGSVSATAFECFTTRKQVTMAREFGARLGDLLFR